MTRKEPIYILSTGRAGSTFLSNLINSSKNNLHVDHQKKGSRIINIVGNLPFNNPFYLGILKRLFIIYDRGYYPYSTVDPLVSISLYKFIINENLTGKVIHLVRDPSSFVESFMNWKGKSLRKQFLHHCVPFWNPVPFFSDSKIDLLEWMKMNKFEKFCWTWYYKNKSFYDLKKNSQDYLLLRLEDITSENINKRQKTLEQLGNYLDLSFKDKSLNTQDKINRSPKKFFPPFTNWSERQKKVLKKYCGDLAKEFGYKLD